MRHLFAAWPEVATRLKGAGHILLLSDYDGTLTPIVERPELAELPPQMRELLQKLARRSNVMVGIISGRALSDLMERVAIDGLTYAGNHGLEIEGPGFSFVNPVAAELKPLLRLLHQVLTRTLEAIKGAFVENKGLTLSVHYRQVENEQEDALRRSVERVLAPSRAVGKLRTTMGKKVYEVRPAVDWDKGKAIELLLERHLRGGRRKPLVIFLGDDLTDEDGFKAVEKHNGISIFVGEPEANTRASYFLHSPLEVEKFLALLLEPKARLRNGMA